MVLKWKPGGAVTMAAAAGVFCLLTAGCGSGGGTAPIVGLAPQSSQSTRMVYAMTNGDTGNAVVAFTRDADTGTLTLLNSYATGGVGTGKTKVSPITPGPGQDPLNSQGSLIFSQDKRLIFVVNAGSGTVSSFRVNNDGSLTLADTKSSGGLQPNALGSHGDLLYVSNVGNPSNSYTSSVSGFRVSSNGTLTPITGATYSLSTPTAQPASVVFNPSGSLVSVSEFTTSKISVFRVNSNGTLSAPKVNTSGGQSPFGAYFTDDSHLLVADATFPPAPSGASSYQVASDGTLTPLSAYVTNGKIATCWIIPTPDEKMFYTTNTADSTISLFAVNTDGTISLVSAVVASRTPLVSGLVDGAVSSDGKYLYANESGLGTVVAYRIEAGGGLTLVQTVSGHGLPSIGTEGMLVR